MPPKTFIPVGEPLLNGNEKKYLNECIDTGWISSEGPFVKCFEEQFALRVGRKFGIAVSSGTAALDVAVEALNIGRGDEVIVPAFTIISCVGQIIRVGATPVLVDSDPITWNMDVAQIESRITNRTKAIMVVHTYGLPVDLDPVLDIADRYGLKIIEDSAEVHGQTYKGAPCGSFGDVSAFSFYSNKHVTTGEGGMIVTDDASLAETCRGLRNLCFQSKKRFVHERLGWNYRMSNLQAAVGVAQLERLDEFIERKRCIGRRYTELLNSLYGVQLPLAHSGATENIYWVYGLVLGDHIDIDAMEVMKLLASKKVGTRPFFCPMHWQPALKSAGLFSDEDYPVAERLYQRGLYIPCGIAMTDDQIEWVAGAVIEVLR